MIIVFSHLECTCALASEVLRHDCDGNLCKFLVNLGVGTCNESSNIRVEYLYLINLKYRKV